MPTWWFSDERLTAVEAETEADARAQAAVWFAEHPPGPGALYVEDYDGPLPADADGGDE